MDRLTYMSSDPEIRAEYKARIREMNRIRAGQTVKYKEGLEKGRREERKKAYAEKVKMIKNMLEAGLSVEQNSKISDLCTDEVKKLTS